MKRVAAALVVLGVLGVLASVAQAHTPAFTTTMAASSVVGHGPHGHYHGHHQGPSYVGYGWRPPVVVTPPRPVYIPGPPPCRTYYRPYSGIYYSNRGMSIGIGF